MRKVVKPAKVKTLLGEPLPEPITFTYVTEELESSDPIPVDFTLDDDDKRQIINARVNAKARAEAQAAAFKAAGISVKVDLTDESQALRNIVKSLVAQGFDETTAEASAKTMLANKPK